MKCSLAAALLQVTGVEAGLAQVAESEKHSLISPSTQDIAALTPLPSLFTFKSVNAKYSRT